MIVELTVGLILTIVNYFGELLTEKIKAHSRSKMISFGAGISISYLFLLLLPDLYEGVSVINKVIFIYILFGFSVFHALEKHIYQHVDRERLHIELKEAHSLAFFIYHFTLGLVAVRLFAVNIFSGILFFIPITFHTLVSGVSMEEIHYKINERTIIRFLLSLAPLAGVLFGLTVNISQIVFFMILAFIIGAFVYITIRDILPKEKKGYLEYFLTRVIFYSIAIVAVWFFTGNF